jgi:hypothetical protein
MRILPFPGEFPELPVGKEGVFSAYSSKKKYNVVEYPLALKKRTRIFYLFCRET